METGTGTESSGRSSEPQWESAPAADSPRGAPAEDTRDERRRARATRRDQQAGGNMLPARGRRVLGVERLLVRLIATVGIIGIAVALGAILTSSGTAGWIIGLVIGLVTVILAAILWSSRQL